MLYSLEWPSGGSRNHLEWLSGGPRNLFHASHCYEQVVHLEILFILSNGLDILLPNSRMAKWWIKKFFYRVKNARSSGGTLIYFSLIPKWLSAGYGNPPLGSRMANLELPSDRYINPLFGFRMAKW